jgi:peptidyl-prolyl cis-trans isomerase D
MGAQKGEGGRGMLRTMRENMKSLSVALWIVVAAFIGTIFLVWGKGGLEGDKDTLAHVGNRVITYMEFRRSYARAYDFYRKMFKDKFSEDLMKRVHLKEQVLNSLINDKLIDVVAQKEGIKVYPQEVVDEISKMEAFKTNGRFDPQRYNQLLQLNRLTPAEFERDIEASLLKEKVLALVKDSAVVSPAEVRDEIIYGMEKIKLKYAELIEGDLEPYYQKHKEEFRVPEKVRVAYIPFLIGDFKKRVKVEEGEMKKYYQENMEEFPAPTKVHLLVITIKDKKDLGKVEDALNTQGFSEVARRYSHDSLSAKGGDMGWVEVTSLPATVAQAVSSLREESLSKPVKVGKGFKIFKVVERKEGGVRPFDEVKGVIEKHLLGEAARKEALRSAARARQMLKKGSSMEGVAKALGLSVVTPPLFSKGEGIPKAPPKLAQVAFEVAEGSLSDIVRTKDGFYILKVLEKRPSYVPPLKYVKDRVEEVVKLQKGRELLYKEADHLVSQAESKSLKGALKAMGLSKVEIKFSPFISRAAPGLWERQIVEKAFDLGEGKYAWAKKGKGVVIFAVADRQEVKEGVIERLKPRVDKALLSRRQKELEDQWFKDLRSRIEVKMDERLWGAL